MVSRQPQQRQVHSGQLQQRNTRLFIFILIGFCLFFFLRYTSRLIEYSQELYNVEQWENKVEQSKLEQAELLAFRDYVRTDAYVEEIGRQQLLMARPGDTLVVILPDDKSAPGSGDVTPATGLDDNASTIEGSIAGEANVPDAYSVTVNGDDALGDLGAAQQQGNNYSQDSVGQPSSSGTTSANPSRSYPSSIQNEPSWRQWILLFSQPSE